MTRHLLKNQKGTELVEFAIVGLLLFLVLFGTIDFALLLFDKQVITNASREGARRGIVQSSPRISVGEMQSVANNYCKNYLINFTKTDPVVAVKSTSGTICGAFGEDLTVTVSYNYKFLAIPNVMKAAGGSLSDPFTLVSQTVMKCE